MPLSEFYTMARTRLESSSSSSLLNNGESGTSSWLNSQSMDGLLPDASEAKQDMEKLLVPPLMASSSVCSVNSTLKKKKSHEIDESNDFDEDFVGVGKGLPFRGSKRRRRVKSAEVHNLSERVKTDIINEKMQALQELIPNCNKVDKVSMLEEAIEYMKTLQLQIQIMSMGTSLCMPQMTHFSPLGMGLGMGMMNMSMNFQGPHFPPLASTSPMSIGFQGMATNFQGYGQPIPPSRPFSSNVPILNSIDFTKKAHVQMINSRKQMSNQETNKGEQKRDLLEG